MEVLNKMKKTILLLLALVLIASIFTGCGQTEEEPPVDDIPPVDNSDDTDEEPVGEPTEGKIAKLYQLLHQKKKAKMLMAIQ